jgi:hypothetical protein
MYRGCTGRSPRRRRTMKTRISLIVAIAVAGLAVSVPAALAEGRLAGSPEPVDAVAYFHANELATAAQSGSAVSSYRDAFERAEPPFTRLAPPVSAEDGTSIAWGQIGISFVVGLLLAVGLMLAMRRPSRPLTQ